MDLRKKKKKKKRKKPTKWAVSYSNVQVVPSNLIWIIAISFKIKS